MCTINKNLALGITLVCTASPQPALRRDIELTVLPCLPCSQYCSVVPQRGHCHSELAQVAALNRSAGISGMLAPPLPGRSWRGMWTVFMAASPRCCAHAQTGTVLEPCEGCCLLTFTSATLKQNCCKGKQQASDVLFPSNPMDDKGCSAPTFYTRIAQRLGWGATLHTTPVIHVICHLTSHY